ncbi:2-deoxyribose-5-phosphate aldolase [Corynebacterium kalidii]|uniref:2-deoxyribose-5-phosphate aldolase n=1 Tax=Corynebacterium kalidii TaxID=2931982 RepID=A0A9X2B185_9CORY|nr:2-deoxyribose-5-phosphate aldolase [Corynebacterium kalidii]
MSGGARVERVMLDPTCTREDADALVTHAVDHGDVAVCVPPTLFPLRHAPETLRLVTVAGYPSGKHHPLVKASEAHMAVVNGAHEVHVVLDPAYVAAGDVNAMISEIVTLREAVPSPAVLRVAPGEYGVDPDDERLRAFCRAAVTAGADMVSAGSQHEAGVMLDAVQGTPVTVASPVDLPGVARVTVPR